MWRNLDRPRRSPTRQSRGTGLALLMPAVTTYCRVSRTSEGSVLMSWDSLLPLRTPQPLLEQVAVAATEIVAYDQYGTGRRWVITGAASPCCHTREAVG